MTILTNMPVKVVLWTSLVAAGWAGAAQTPQAPGPPATGVILGSVVDAGTASPVASVVVTLAPTTVRAASESRRAITSATGGFAFREVPPGRYTLATTVGGMGYGPGGYVVSGRGHLIAGYLNGGYGQRRPNGFLATLDVPDGARLGDISIRIWKSGAIEGSVFDESGEPLVGVVVAAVRVSSDGRLVTGPTTKTDDRGRYRAGALAPGHYVVVVPQMQLTLPSSTIDHVLAAPNDPATRRALTGSGGVGPTAGGIRAGGGVLIPAPQVLVTNSLPPAARDDRQHVYRTTFHPASPTLADAERVILESGEERAGVDVRLHPVPAVAVSGTLTDAAGPVAHFALRLLPADDASGTAVRDVAMTATDGRGTFTFPLVPPGVYRIVAERPTPPAGAPTSPPSLAETPGAWAIARVSVSDVPIDGLALRLRPGLTVSGRFEFHGAAARPTPVRLSSAARLVPVDTGRFVPPFRANVDAAGGFAFGGIPPGRYVVRASALDAWTLQSVSIAGRDVTDAPFEVGDGDLDGLVISFTDARAQLEGTVSAPQGMTAEDATVFVFPPARSRWRDARVSTMSFQAVRVTNAGAFSIRGLPPGDYLVVAAAEERAGDWPDESLLARLAAVATLVRLEPAGRSTLALRMPEIR
jgi:protocatechuate 3,4-dioxygenase beta subunit